MRKNCFMNQNGMIHKFNEKQNSSICENTEFTEKDKEVACYIVTKNNACSLCFPDLFS